MLELNFINFVLIPVILFIFYLICSRLQKQPEYKRVSSYVPSMTKTFWSKMLFSWDLARKPLLGKIEKCNLHTLFINTF